jgi:hypothetical protein
MNKNWIKDNVHITVLIFIYFFYSTRELPLTRQLDSIQQENCLKWGFDKKKSTTYRASSIFSFLQKIRVDNLSSAPYKKKRSRRASLSFFFKVEAMSTHSASFLFFFVLQFFFFQLHPSSFLKKSSSIFVNIYLAKK